MWEKGSRKEYKQRKMYVTFKDNKEENELADFIEEEAAVGGKSNYFKRLALEDMRKKKEGGKWCCSYFFCFF